MSNTIQLNKTYTGTINSVEENGTWSNEHNQIFNCYIASFKEGHKDVNFLGTRKTWYKKGDIVAYTFKDQGGFSARIDPEITKDLQLKKEEEEQIQMANSSADPNPLKEISMTTNQRIARGLSWNKAVDLVSSEAWQRCNALRGRTRNEIMKAHPKKTSEELDHLVKEETLTKITSAKNVILADCIIVSDWIYGKVQEKPKKISDE
jgi:hypothetical protein